MTSDLEIYNYLKQIGFENDDTNSEKIFLELMSPQYECSFLPKTNSTGLGGTNPSVPTGSGPTKSGLAVGGIGGGGLPSSLGANIATGGSLGGQQGLATGGGGLGGTGLGSPQSTNPFGKQTGNVKSEMTPQATPPLLSSSLPTMMDQSSPTASSPTQSSPSNSKKKPPNKKAKTGQDKTPTQPGIVGNLSSPGPQGGVGVGVGVGGGGGAPPGIPSPLHPGLLPPQPTSSPHNQPLIPSGGPHMNSSFSPGQPMGIPNRGALGPVGAPDSSIRPPSIPSNPPLANPPVTQPPRPSPVVPQPQSGFNSSLNPQATVLTTTMPTPPQNIPGISPSQANANAQGGTPATNLKTFLQFVFVVTKAKQPETHKKIFQELKAQDKQPSEMIKILKEQIGLKNFEMLRTEFLNRMRISGQSQGQGGQQPQSQGGSQQQL